MEASSHHRCWLACALLVACAGSVSAIADEFSSVEEQVLFVIPEELGPLREGRLAPPVWETIVSPDVERVVVHARRGGKKGPEVLVARVGVRVKGQSRDSDPLASSFP